MSKKNRQKVASEFARAKVTRCPICDTAAATRKFSRSDDRYGQPDTFTLVQCSTCTAYYLRDPLAPSELGKLYEKYYPSLELAPAQGHPLRRLIKQFSFPFQLLKKLDATETLLAKVRPGGSVLDVGCGFYPDLPDEVRRTRLVWEGLEIDPKLVDTLQNAGLVCHRGDLLTFQPGKTYDYILLSQVLEHQLQLSEGMEALHKLLKPGGKVLILTPNTDALERMENAENWIHWHTPYHTVLFNKRSIYHLAERHGFSVLRYQTFTPSHWELLQRNYQPGMKGLLNSSFHFQFSPISYLATSLWLRLLDALHPSSNPCMFCEWKKT